MALARSSASKNSSSPGGQPLAQRALHCQALVAAADPLEQHLRGHQEPVAHSAVERLRAQVKRALHPLVARTTAPPAGRDPAWSCCGSGCETPAERSRSAAVVRRARTASPAATARGGSGVPRRRDLVRRADVPGARRKRRLAFPLRLPQQERPDRIRPVERIVQRPDTVSRPDEPALQVGQMQRPSRFSAARLAIFHGAALRLRVFGAGPIGAVYSRNIGSDRSTGTPGPPAFQEGAASGLEVDAVRSCS